MFALAGASFVFGGWQYLQARSVASAAQERMAFMVTTIQKSNLAQAQKKDLYTTIMRDLPSAPAVFSLDFSDSFASQDTGDSCTSDGQRTICLSLQAAQTDRATMTAICGTCNPQ